MAKHIHIYIKKRVKDAKINVKSEVQLELMRLIKLMGGAVNVKYQQITQAIDDQFPDLTDSEFEEVKKEAISQLSRAREAHLKTMFR